MMTGWALTLIDGGENWAAKSAIKTS